MNKLYYNKDICMYIFKTYIKDKKRSLDLIKGQHVDYDFYNWLNHDILIRESLSDNNNNWYMAGTLGFYQYHYQDLGLLNFNNGDYNRTKSLSDCFNSKWWKTNHKTHYNKWYYIHRNILFDIDIKIYLNDKSNLTYLPNEIYDIDEEKVLIEFELNNFRDPTIKERNKIIENYYHIIDGSEIQNIDDILEWFIHHKTYILVDKNFQFIS